MSETYGYDEMMADFARYAKYLILRSAGEEVTPEQQIVFNAVTDRLMAYDEKLKLYGHTIWEWWNPSEYALQDNSSIGNDNVVGAREEGQAVEGNEVSPPIFQWTVVPPFSKEEVRRNSITGLPLTEAGIEAAEKAKANVNLSPVFPWIAVHDNNPAERVERNSITGLPLTEAEISVRQTMVPNVGVVVLNANLIKNADGSISAVVPTSETIRAMTPWESIEWNLRKAIPYVPFVSTANSFKIWATGTDLTGYIASPGERQDAGPKTFFDLVSLGVGTTPKLSKLAINEGKVFEQSIKESGNATSGFIKFSSKVDAENWGNKNFRIWEQQLSSTERRAIKDYTNIEYYPNINNVLRGIESEFAPGNAEKVTVITNALKKASVPEAVIVYRGVGKDALGNLRDLPPKQLIRKVIEDKGYMSTSLLREGAFNKPVFLTIKVPQGTGGAFIGNISDFGSEEMELLLNKGNKMVIQEVTAAGTGNMELVCELLP